MSNVERAQRKIDAAINGSNGLQTSNNLLLEAIGLLMLEIVELMKKEGRL